MVTGLETLDYNEITRVAVPLKDKRSLALLDFGTDKSTANLPIVFYSLSSITLSAFCSSNTGSIYLFISHSTYGAGKILIPGSYCLLSP